MNRPSSASLLAALLLAPAALHAQHAEVGLFTTWSPAISDGQPLFGGSVGGGRGVGFRASGALRTRDFFSSGTTAATEGRTTSVSGWMADVDATYDTRNNALLQPLAAALLGFHPMVFTGAGVAARRDAAGAMKVAPAFSYGGGISRALGTSVYVTTEARRRAFVRDAEGAVPAGFRNGWEYRAGLSFRFGGTRRPGTTTIPGIPFPIPMPGGGSAGGGGAPISSARAEAVLETGDDYLGTPYVYGGTTPRGFDCSGFVQYVFGRNGVRLPRTSRQQAEVGQRLPTRVSALRPGDLMLFSAGGERIDHVAIYAGDNRILHSSSSGNGVRYDDLSTQRGRWFVGKMVAARRMVDSRGNSVIDAATLARVLRETVTAFDAPDRGPRP